MRYLSPFILIAFTCFAYPHVNYANAVSGDIQYEQCSKPIHEVYDLKGGNDELIERRAHETPATLCASLDGVTFEIDSTEWEDQFIYLSLVLVEDFDGDGWEEAIIKLSTGGNGCCWEHYLVSYAGEGYFKITTDDFLFTQTTLVPVITKTKLFSKPLLVLKHGIFICMRICKNTASTSVN